MRRVRTYNRTAHRPRESAAIGRRLHALYLLTRVPFFVSPVEQGFITFVVRPVYTLMVKIAPKLTPTLALIDANHEAWGKIAAAGADGSTPE